VQVNRKQNDPEGQGALAHSLASEQDASSSDMLEAQKNWSSAGLDSDAPGCLFVFGVGRGVGFGVGFGVGSFVGAFVCSFVAMGISASQDV
jgi:hypothetical protein